MEEPQGNRTYHFDYQHTTLFCEFYKPEYGQHQEQPPPLKKRKHTTNTKRSSVQFCFEFRIRCKQHLVVQKLDGDLITVVRKQFPTIINTFIEDPHYFKYTVMLQRSVSNMLIKVGFHHTPEHIKSNLIQYISSKTCQILNSVSSMGRPILSLGINITCNFVYVHYELDDFTEQVMRRSEIEASESLKMVPASRKAIDGLEKMQFDGGDSIINNVCTICLDEFEMGLQITRLPCGHGFHGKCITHWLEKSHVCPICRFEMPVD